METSRAEHGRSLWPFLFAAAVFLSLLLLQYLQIVGALGRYVYPIDDAYIHLAMGRNVAEHGVWGNTRYEFASASSSPLWTLLLAGAHLVFGSDLAPIVLNAVVGIALLLLAHLWISRYVIQPVGRALVLVLILLAVPLPLMALSGMEHLLHTLLACWFLALLLQFFEEGARPSLVLLALAGFLMVSARYEGLYLLLVGCLALAVGRRFVAGLATLLAGLSPVVVYGVVSVTHGAMFLPNSIAIKGARMESLGDLVSALIKPIARIPNLDQGSWLVVFGLAGVLLVLTRPGRFSRHERVGILAFAASVYLHAATADFGWLYRYEAYLFALALLFVIVPYLRAILDTASVTGVLPKLAVIPLLLILAYPALRIKQTFSIGRRAAKNIHDQQVQMARFVALHYNKEAIAANDIGALSYFTDARIVDLFGLGSNEIAKLKKAGRFDTQAIERITQAAGVRLAIVYPEWFSGSQALPERWTRAGTLRIEDNFVCAFPDTHFYAVDPSVLDQIQLQLTAFAAVVPKDVVVALVASQSPSSRVR